MAMALGSGANGQGRVVKSEPRHDDHEINEMARKIVEQNRTKVNMMHPNSGHMSHMQMARPGQPVIQNYMQQGSGSRAAVPPHLAGASGTVKAASTASSQDATGGSDRKLDAESRKGRFGWCEFEKNHIPYIFRGNGDRFTSVRMVERKFLSRFLNVLPPEVNSCHCIRSYYITESESKLLNEINLRHTDCFFGKDPFTVKDLVVRLRDAKEFYRFLDLCHKKLVLKKSNASDRCGFFRINGESVVPYTVRDGVKYVPLFYFEGETDHLKLKSDRVDGWDLAYLKFCCKVQGIRNELFADEFCRVVALDEIKGHFPPGTTFEDYWPAKGSITPVNSQRASAGNWTQKPPPAHSNNSTAMTNGVNKHGHASSLSSSISSTSSPYSRTAAAAAAAAAAVAPSSFDAQLLANHNLQQLFRQGLNPSTLSQLNSLTSAASLFGTNNAAAAAAMAAMVGSKQFPAKLTQIKEFPIEPSSQPPYKLQKALIDQKIVPCINVRPYVFHDLMMTLPDFVKFFCPPGLGIDRATHMLHDILNVVLYKGNKGHQQILRGEGKCSQYDPVPLVLVKDIMNYMTQMKYIFEQTGEASHHQPSSKRIRTN